MKAAYHSHHKAKLIGKKYGYHYDRELSSKHAKVYHDDNYNPIVVFRGTDITDWNDLKTDAAIALGMYKHTKRYQEAKELTKAIRNKYGSKKLTALGHSLGGKIAEGINADRVITYNKAAGLGDIKRNIPKNQIDIKSLGDPVSMLSHLDTGQGKTVHVIPKHLNFLYTHNLSSLI